MPVAVMSDRLLLQLASKLKVTILVPPAPLVFDRV